MRNAYLLMLAAIFGFGALFGLPYLYEGSHGPRDCVPSVASASLCSRAQSGSPGPLHEREGQSQALILGLSMLYAAVFALLAVSVVPVARRATLRFLSLFETSPPSARLATYY